ncbi:uncharacterized protein SCHCODRAFT_02601599 [Schizophyllum commune H4-8]|uniref:Uncharacterized protein n=1 Tax=Schizophyllum commune (strain H4-8 / FGSC 9210) TaxID=578458 RepID=D8QCB7_SCHCM|nr:uncharacterized protein SCHCODRAFT_02601599 [Schizophyllum commune H4-8]KAI5889518.1 hypothetical protein SCHCODRAFT_02601599 [Schizophyllum commune H4-8]
MLLSTPRDIQLQPLSAGDVEDLKLIVMQEGVEVLFYGIQATLLVAALAALTNVVQMPSLGLNAELALPELLNKLNIAFIVATRFNLVYHERHHCRLAGVDALSGQPPLGVLVECVTYIKVPKNGLQSSAIMMEIPLLITNAVSTILVARLVSDWRKTSRAERILILLLESGTLYCILWVVRFGIDLYDGAGTVYLVYSGILPTLILLVVAMRRSATTSLLLSTQVSQGMRFADGAETQGRSLTTLDETQLDSLDETQLNSMDGRTFTSGRTASMASPKNAKDLPLEDLGRVRGK